MTTLAQPDFLIEGGTTLQCSCGQKYHVSVFYEAIRRAVRAALRLHRRSDDEIVEDATVAAYRGDAK